MSKKAATDETSVKKKIIKIFVTAEQAHLLRVAAALQDQSTGDWSRDVVLAAAAKATSGMAIGGNAEPTKKRN
jgi:uncharacterized protein (DUF1778 family)